MALLLAQARNVPQANADLRAGRWNRSKWEGVELHGKTLGIVGLGPGRRARRAAGARVRDATRRVRPVREPGSRPPARRAARRHDGRAGRDLRLRDDPRDQDARHDRPRERRGARARQARACGSSTPGRGGIVDEEALADAVRDGRLGGAAIDTFAKEPTTESPLFELDNVVVTPHLGASTAEAQDKAGETIAEQVVLALRGDFVPFAVNVAASEASEVVRPFLPLAERLGRLFSGLAGGAPETLEVFYEGEIADYDCRVLTLSILKGVLGPVVAEPVTFVNAPQLAEARGIAVRETKSADARELREPHRGARQRSASAPRRPRARCSASTRARASSASTSTPSTCRPRATCSWCTTPTRPA